jgi:hypothetical protein
MRRVVASVLSGNLRSTASVARRLAERCAAVRRKRNGQLKSQRDTYNIRAGRERMRDFAAAGPPSAFHNAFHSSAYLAS